MLPAILAVMSRSLVALGRRTRKPTLLALTLATIPSSVIGPWFSETLLVASWRSHHVSIVAAITGPPSSTSAMVIMSAGASIIAMT